MRSSFVRFVGVLLLAAACSSSSPSEPGGGAEIRSQQDLKNFFDAVMPQLVAAFTELASQLSTPAFSLKGGGDSSISVGCPQGGTLVVNPEFGDASLNGCGVDGAVINATLFLVVQPTGPSSYQANFSGPLTVSGSFNGTVEVIEATVRWNDPPSVDTTFYDVTVLVGEETVTVTSADLPTGDACPWDRSGQATEVRVHAGNGSGASGVFVELTAGGLTCAIEDENRVLQLPVFGATFPENRNTVSAGDTFGGLGQALMPVGEGDPVTIAAQYQGQMITYTCTVNADAFDTGPGATAGQAFFDVFTPFDPVCPPIVSCGFGFNFASSDTAVREGPSCNPEMPFTCNEDCFEVCEAGETFSFGECGAENRCQCNCVSSCGF